ncbi:MAG: radical SAM protein [Clostridia bacterium]|nr:radical SAM protein [Clostridia bacterium]
MSECRLCPRRCGALRADGGVGFCGAGKSLRVSRAALHFWEEPPISGTRGSGTVFFSHCPLKCIYCQNYAISTGGDGLDISVDRLVDIFFELAAAGAHNINLVSPTQYTAEIIAAIKAARARGFALPVVWNTGGYELPETLRRLAGLVDIYLTDFKYMSPRLAEDFSAAPDYPAYAKAALCEMLRQQPECRYDGDGILRRGVIVRHLVLPGCTDDTKDVLDYLADDRRARLSLMGQYTPQPTCAHPQLSRPITEEEYADVIGYAELLGFTDAFVQERESAKESFIPKFDYTGVLPERK